jgi:hypothetical protein
LGTNAAERDHQISRCSLVALDRNRPAAGPARGRLSRSLSETLEYAEVETILREIADVAFSAVLPEGGCGSPWPQRPRARRRLKSG